MIGTIRNPWIRRPLVVLVWPICLVAVVLLGMAAGVYELAKDTREVW